MKIGPEYLHKINELDAWLGKSTQKTNFLKILGSYEDIQKKITTAPKNENVKEAGESKISKKILDAVEGYIGKDYSEVNCYELVVEGLEKSGINYRGQNGMAEYLADKAKTQNMPFNTFMTGEGLVENLGEVVFSRQINLIGEPKSQAKEIAGEMEGMLKKGSILSFSMQTKGHTGVISKSDDSWTYINSGNMDHNIRESRLKKAVGEEPLEAEILNWLKLSKNRKEPLTITLGIFDDRKLSAFSDRKTGLSIKA